jgi:hypothetical protein
MLCVHSNECEVSFIGKGGRWMLTVYFGTPSSLHFGLDLIMELTRH